MLHRTISRWLAVAVLAGTCSLAATAPASAATFDPCTTLAALACPSEPALARANHVGWAYLNLNHCPAGMACAMVFRDNTSAWRWSGSAWQQTYLRQGWVYLYPYSGQWRWAWTQSTGWVAINGGRFELRSY